MTFSVAQVQDFQGFQWLFDKLNSKHSKHTHTEVWRNKLQKLSEATGSVIAADKWKFRINNVKEKHYQYKIAG